MTGWDGDGHSGGARPEHGPSEDRGEAAWGTRPPDPHGLPPAPAPEWASARTETFSAPAPVPPPPAPAPVPFPAPVPAPAPEPPRVRRLFLVLLTAAVVGAGAGTGVWYLIRDDSPAGGAATTALPSVAARTSPPAARTSAPPSPSTVPPPADPPAASPSAVPTPGYRRTQDPVGYTLDVPAGWIRSQRQGEKAPVVQYDAPEGDRGLQIFALSEDSAAESLDLAENDPGFGFAARPGYRPLDRASAAGWAELTYRYADGGGGPRLVVDHRFAAADGTLYAIRASGPEALGAPLVRAPLAAALASFCPAGPRCG